MRSLALVVFALLFTGAAQAGTRCEWPEKSTGSIYQAIDKVKGLPELSQLKKEQTFPIVYGAENPKQQYVEGKCLWIVPVYLDQPSGYKIWNLFFAATNNDTVYRTDGTNSALVIPVEKWREQEKAKQQ